MFRPFFHKAFLIAISAFAVFSHASDVQSQDNFRFSLGAGIRNQTPVVAIGGIGYKNVQLYVQGMGFHYGANDFWCGVRGSLLWAFFSDFPFRFEAGVGGGYEYAEAPNEMNNALNVAHNEKYVYPYNYKELLDITADLRINLFGVFTQISFPAYRFKDHDAPDFSWRVGYLMEF
jgi:hypothetical protein